MFQRLLSLLARLAIRAYRRYLSPHKGYRCAWGRRTGRDTCSGVGLRVFRKRGFFAGMALMQRQFDRCALAGAALAQDHGVHARQRPRPLNTGRRGQAGEIDCDPGCVGIDNACEFAQCCDIPHWGSTTPPGDSSSRRAERARAREQERRERREARRSGR